MRTQAAECAVPTLKGRIAIDQSKCVGCGACVEAAGDGGIVLKDNKAAPARRGLAVLPREIVENCPGGAISILEFPWSRSGGAAFPGAYLSKMKGGALSPARVDNAEILCAWIGAFLGIGAVALISAGLTVRTDLALLIGSFGASAVLIYGAIKSPLAQPRNLVGGHVISALIGVACARLFPDMLQLAAPLAVATAIAAMHATRTLHPPGGATALIAVIGGPAIHRLGFLYAVFPVAAGALVMLLVALLVNNIPRDRKYPEFWL